MKSDVTVIGAGPAGAITAKVIAEHGFDVILVEKDEYPGKTNVCAGGMPKLLLKDVELSQKVAEKEISGDIHFFPWGSKSSDLDHITVYRHVFDRALADKAVEKGAKLLTNMLIKDVSLKDDKISVDYGKGIIESKLVVFADGPNSLAYRKFGIGFKPEADKTIVSVVCEVKWEDNPLNNYEFYYGYNISPWGYGWIFPKRDTVNVGVGCLYSKLRSNIIDSLNYLLKKCPLTCEKLKGREITWLNSALIPVAPAKQIFGERMLVVGDAAGMADPISGGGILHAINGGKLAGEICIKALEVNDFSSTFLSQYQRLWHKTEDYFYIYSKYLLSNVFLYLFKFDRNAYPRLAAIALEEGIRKIFNMLKFYYRR